MYQAKFSSETPTLQHLSSQNVLIKTSEIQHSLMNLKMLIYLLYIRKKTIMISQIIDQLVFCHFYQNHLNVFYMSKQKAIPKIYCNNIREDFEKNSARNIRHQQYLENGKKSQIMAEVALHFWQIFQRLLQQYSLYNL